MAAEKKSPGRIRRAGHRVRHHTGRAREAARRRRTLDLAWRSAVFVLGVLLVVGGIVLLPLPGPGWVVIFLGLGLLATEFAWAARVLHEAKHRFDQAKEKALRPRDRSTQPVADPAAADPPRQGPADPPPVAEHVEEHVE